MKQVILYFFILTIAVFAKDDFYYGFIDSNSQQISEDEKNAIERGYDSLENIRNLANEGKVVEAIGKLDAFKQTNNLEILRSDTILLESELLLKKRNNIDFAKGEKILEEAISRSYIDEDDLAQGYMLLIELKLGLNKTDDAKYYIDTIKNSFDSELTQAYAGIYLAKYYVHKKDYENAIKTLYTILAKTKKLEIATLVADELFDVYLLNNQKDAAKKLAQQVLNSNIDYYANDSKIATQKIEELLKNDMPDLAATILKELIKRTQNILAIEEFRFELAQAYMQMYTKGNEKILEEAKELYSEVLNDYPNGKYANDAKMIIDEILMREGKLEPSLVNSKYPDSNLMYQKVLMQELLNHISKEEYEAILKSKKVYTKISKEIFKRFGYESLEPILNDVRLLLIEQYLKNAKCKAINEILDPSMKEALKKLIFDENLQYEYFECLLEYPTQEGYMVTKNALSSSRDAQTYLYLEELAFKLKKYDEAMDFSAKLDLLDEKEFLKKEFLLKFEIISTMQNETDMMKFLIYADKNRDLIVANENNPLIMDFYYRYYFYLINKDENDEAFTILEKLYQKQNEYDAHIYSPKVEIELAKDEKRSEKYEEAIDYLEQSIKNTRSIKNNELAEIYYELIKLYELTNKNELYSQTLTKCKELDPATTTSFYKKMCDEL